MTIDIFIFIWLALIAFVSGVFVQNYSITEDGRRIYYWGIIISLAIFFPIYWMAVSGVPRFDTVLYVDLYKNLPDRFAVFLQQVSEENGGKGFLFFEYAIKKLSGGNVTAFRMILGLVHAIPVVLVYRKYSENYIFSLFVFVASACHFAWMMNGLRQFMAVSIILLATPLILRKKYFLSILVILLAATVHTSALIMIPVIFIIQGRAWNYKTIMYIIATVVLMYLFGRYTNLLDTLLVGTEYEGSNSYWVSHGDDGVNPIRVMVSAVPAIMGFFARKYISPEDVETNVFINLSIITVGINIVGMTTTGIMIGRLPIYTAIYSYMLIPNLINRMFESTSAKLVSVIAIVLYLAYYIVEISASGI